jgi:LysM repeat protein
MPRKIWELLEHLPGYWWGYLALTLGVIGLVAWGQTSLLPKAAPPPTVQIVLPTRPTATTATATPTPNQVASLADSPGVAIVNMTPLASPTVTPSPTATPTPLFTFHTVKADETLITIAAHYGISTEALLAANDIRDPNQLEPGKHLLIPPRQGLRVPVVPHTVTAQDTLLSLALKYSSSVKKILAANPGLNPDSLPVGQAIAVPVVFREEKPVALASAGDEPVVYTVVEGDTPLAIAYEYGIPVELLLAANEITDPTGLQIGQQLIIPPSEGLTQGVPIILYDLEEGDSLLELASKYGSSIKDILAVNPHIIPSSLKSGETVAIPVIFAPPRPTPDPALVNRPKPTPMPPPPSLDQMAGQMVAGVNAEREKAGLPSYRIDQEIAAMALTHAQDMVVRGFFSHVTPEGLTLSDRFADAGIGAVNMGEDIQRNTKPAQETVAFALNWFMSSRPHRANILHPNHNRIGVGVVEGPPGWYTFVLVFAEK